ncbi:MAG: hypothetical protein ACK8QZ_03980 [Anaerolineales bacterium]
MLSPSPSLGIRNEVWEWLQEESIDESGTEKPPIPDEIRRLVELREQARRNRDWAIADMLRAEILRLGWQIQDTREGPRLLPR